MMRIVPPDPSAKATKAILTWVIPIPIYLFAVVLTCIRAYQKRTAEHLLRVGEIEPMLPDVRAVLSLVPFKSHCNSNCSYTPWYLLGCPTPHPLLGEVAFR